MSFSDVVKAMFKEESDKYNSSFTGGDNLNTEQRRALLINFLNGALVEDLIAATKPMKYINSCKENVDRGAVGNAITAYRFSPKKERLKKLILSQFTAVLLSKKRSVNHNIENTELWLKCATKVYLKTDRSDQGNFKLT